MTKFTLTQQHVLTAQEYIEDLDISSDTATVAAASVSGEVILATPASNGGWTQRTIAQHNAEATKSRFSPDGSLLATGANDGTVTIRDRLGETLSVITGKGWCRDLSWRPDGQQVAGAIGREVHRSAADASSLLVHRDHPTTVECLAWTNDGKHLGVGTYGGVWWYQGAPQPLRRFEWKGALLSLVIAPDDGWAVSGNQDASVHCWRLWRTGDELEMTGYPTKVQHLAFNPTGTHLAVGNLGEVTVWSFSGRGPRGTTPLQFGDHQRHIVALGYRPQNDNTLATVSADGLLCLWQPSTASSTPIATTHVDGEPSCMQWSSDGKLLYVGTAAGEVVAVATNHSPV